MSSHPHISSHHPFQEKYGTYFTPSALAQWMAKESLQILTQSLFTKKQNDCKILDPSIGEGIFFQAFLEYLNSKMGENKKISSQMREIRFYGTDIQEKYVSSVEKDLLKRLKNSNNQNYSFDIQHQNGLNFMQNHPNNFDIIIGNPPYLRQESISSEDKTELILFVKSHFPDISFKFSKQADYYMYFILYGLFALKDPGVLMFIISTSWLNTKFGRSFRELILSLQYEVTFICSPKKRFFPDVEINTMILTIQKKQIKSDIKQNECISVKKITLLSDKQFELSEEFQIQRKILQQYENWEGFLFRLPLEYTSIYLKILELVKPLSNFAEVKSGIYTGLNDFFYIAQSNNLEKLPNQEFLFPLIRSPKMIKSWKIDPQKMKTSVFICRKSKIDLEMTYQKTLEYINWGETQKTAPKQKVVKTQFWNKVPSVFKRKPGWWALPKTIRPSNVFLRYIYYEDYLQPYSNEPILSDRCFHQVFPFKNINSIHLSIILNFSTTKLCIELNGRNSLGLGALKLETMTAKNLPILDCLNLDIWNDIENTHLIEFNEIEKIEIRALKKLGIPNPPEFLNLINNLLQNLIHDRIIKSYTPQPQ